MTAKVELPAGMPTLRVTPMPADANFHGDIFGGWIMSQVDLADAGLIFGTGFAPFRGGPLHYIKTRGRPTT